MVADLECQTGWAFRSWRAFRATALMPKMPHPGEDHRHAVRIGGGDDLVVAFRAARLDHRGGARLGAGEETVGEGEEGVRGDDAASRRGLGEPRRLAGFLGLPAGDAGAVDAAHLAGADTDRGA